MRKDMRRMLLLLIFVIILVFYLHIRLGSEMTNLELMSYHYERNPSSNVSKESLGCLQFPEDMSMYPKCFEKMVWISNGWKSHACYGTYGVDGSVCSFRRYLSVVENHCPPLIPENANGDLIGKRENAEEYIK
ncbi:hypothetical protein DICVIV_07894 [Dictyocaulus viviparus]|uniref:alpha-1,6-mannosyl-glycoprotein 6-beta-N-acetylglucosaminyltransferase n=1 Tax=Dictyocaulus viviparus TaxID=29172 RepID=A0A0D8XQH1_DICVI|nr:hypothetical protein DICVIV_07894 [Dictyocaulus viviparus]